MSEAESKPGEIFKLIPKLIGEVGAISKSKKNQTQGFMYRGIDDVYNAVGPLLAKHGVFSVPRCLNRSETTVETRNGGSMVRVIQELIFRFYAPDASFVDVGPIYGEAMDSGDKATNKSNSIAHKYAFFMLLCIGTEEDPDSVSHEIKAAPAKTVFKEPLKNHAPGAVNPPAPTLPTDPADYVVKFGQYKGKRLRDIGDADVANYYGYLERQAKTTGKPLGDSARDFMAAADKFIAVKIGTDDGDPGPQPPPFDSDEPLPF